jgi:hypothetical protein
MQAPAVVPAPPAPSASIPAPQAPPRTVEAPSLEVQAQNPADLPAPPAVSASPAPSPPPAPARRTQTRKNPPRQGRGAREAKTAQENRPAPPEAKPGEAKPVEPVRPAPSVEEAPAETPEAPPPVLGEVLTPEQRNLYFRELEANLSEAQGLADREVRRRPAARQEEAVTRVRSFIAQAQELRPRDLRAAVSLSRRALTLARALGGSTP